MIEIPLSNSPEQIFNINLSGENYTFRVLVNSRTGLWTLDLSQNNIDILLGVGLVGGVNILDQYNIAITNMFMINTDNPSLDPTVLNLGSVSRLFILNEEELENVQAV